MYVLIVYAYGERRTRRFATKTEALARAAEIAARESTDIVAVRRGRDAHLVYEYVRRPIPA